MTRASSAIIPIFAVAVTGASIAVPWWMALQRLNGGAVPRIELELELSLAAAAVVAIPYLGSIRLRDLTYVANAVRTIQRLNHRTLPVQRLMAIFAVSACTLMVEQPWAAALKASGFLVRTFTRLALAVAIAGAAAWAATRLAPGLATAIGRVGWIDIALLVAVPAVLWLLAERSLRKEDAPRVPSQSQLVETLTRIGESFADPKSQAKIAATTLFEGGLEGAVDMVERMIAKSGGVQGLSKEDLSEMAREFRDSRGESGIDETRR